MYNVGTVCIKIAGRDAGQLCVIVDEKDGKFLIEGAVRRRMVNGIHIEPTGKSVKVAKGADHKTVMKALELEPRETKPKKTPARPRKIRKVKPKVEKKPKVKKAPAPKKTPAEKKAKKAEKSAKRVAKKSGGKVAKEAEKKADATEKKVAAVEKKVEKDVKQDSKTEKKVEKEEASVKSAEKTVKEAEK